MNGINQYGRVTDIELAKRIIIQWLYKFDEEDVKEFIEKVQNNLFEWDGAFFTVRKNNNVYFGGPWGDSGLYLYTLESWYEEYKECPSIDGSERDINSERMAVVDINGSPKVFVIHEYD